MRILQVTAGQIKIPVSFGGGSEAVAWNIAKSLARNNFVRILDGRYEARDPTTDERDAVTIVRLPTKRIRLGFLERLWPLMSLRVMVTSVINQMIFGLAVRSYLAVANSSYDIIHVHNLFVAVVLVNSDFRKKIVYTSHVNTWVLASASITDRLSHSIEKWVMKRAWTCTVLSAAVKKRIVSSTGMSEKSIHVVPNGSDLSLFTPVTSATSDVYRDRNQLTVLYVGRIHPAKGIDCLIQAANIIVNERKRKNVIFVLVGPAESFVRDVRGRSAYSEMIRDLITTLKLSSNVVLLGPLPLDQLITKYQTCDVFVLPSITEATPLVTLEAMSVGKPIVATKVGGVSDQVRDRWNGYLVDPGDNIQLANGIELLISDKSRREKFGLNSRLLAESKYSWSAVARSYFELYVDELSL